MLIVVCFWFEFVWFGLALISCEDFVVERLKVVACCCVVVVVAVQVEVYCVEAGCVVVVESSCCVEVGSRCV